MALQVVHPFGICHRTVGTDFLANGSAVPGDVHLRLPILPVHPSQRPVQPLRVDFPLLEVGRRNEIVADAFRLDEISICVVGDGAPGVVVNSEEVYGRRDPLQILSLHPGSPVGVPLQHILRVGTFEHRVQEPAVESSVVASSRSQILFASSEGLDPLQAVDDPDSGLSLPIGPQHRHSPTVGEQDVVRSLERGFQIFEPRSMVPVKMTDQGSDRGFVVRDPVAHPVAEPAGHRIGVHLEI